MRGQAATAHPIRRAAGQSMQLSGHNDWVLCSHYQIEKPPRRNVARPGII